MDHPLLLNHERIHLRQQAEMLILPFYIWYITEYLIRLLIYKNKKQAYRNISFEREAYANEGDPDYLRHRKLWGFLKFMNIVNWTLQQNRYRRNIVSLQYPIS